jgi:hypothetical protein
MTMNTNISTVTQALVLATALVAASASEACPEPSPAAKDVPPSSAGHAPAPGGMSSAELYAVLHDAALNKRDGLGNYDDDYQARFPK